MLTPAQWNDITPILCAGLISAFWGWAAIGSRKQIHNKVLYKRWIAASKSLIPLMLLSLGSESIARIAHPGVIGIISAGFFCIREKDDPILPILWHHNRLRVITVPILIITSILLAIFLPRPEIVCVLLAGCSFHRHLAGNIAMLSQSLSEIEALSAKILALETKQKLVETFFVEGHLENTETKFHRKPTT